MRIHIGERTKVIIALFALYTIFLAFNYPTATNLILHRQISGYLLYFFSQPAFIFIAYFIIKHSRKNLSIKLFASLLIILAIEFISYPQCAPLNGEPVVACSDYFIVRWMNQYLPYTWCWYLYYIILPITFIGVAAYLLGDGVFVSKLQQIGKL